MYYATTAYNIYVASLPCYVAQLDDYPPQMKQVEERTLRSRAAAGPYRWAMPEDLSRLADHYGQSANFRDPEATALAAKVRVATFENNRHGGLHVTSRARALLRAAAASTKLGRRALWHAWIQQNPLFTLERAVQQVKLQGLSPASIMQGLSGQAQRPWTQPTLKRIRARFLSTLTTHPSPTSGRGLQPRFPHEAQDAALAAPGASCDHRRPSAPPIADAQVPSGAAGVGGSPEHTLEPVDDGASLPATGHLRPGLFSHGS